MDRGDAAHAVDRGAVAVRGRCARRALLSHHARADARPGPDLGQTFEREAIEDWLKTHKTDPVTGEKLLETDVIVVNSTFAQNKRPAF